MRCSATSPAAELCYAGQGSGRRCANPKAVASVGLIRKANGPEELPELPHEYLLSERDLCRGKEEGARLIPPGGHIRQSGRDWAQVEARLSQDDVDPAACLIGL